MRALDKGANPAILIEHGAVWTTEFVAAHSADSSARGHWGHDDIRSSLAQETSNKCAYCEAFVPDVSYEHVEHIRPKSKFPELAHDWSNLTSACSRCNTNKGSYYIVDSEVLDPYNDDPTDHLLFIGNMVTHVLESKRGEITWRKLQLGRLDLANSRMVRLNSVHEAFLRWYEAEEPLRSVLAGALTMDAAEGEFTAAVQEYLRQLGFPL